MKQSGKTWTTADGMQTLAKYLPAHERLFEKLGQKIAAEAVAIESRLRDAKAEFIDYCKQAYRNCPGNAAQRRFSFTTFDKEFKIEFDIKEENVRVYRATRKNPSSKDYELINMDFNRSVTNENGTSEEMPAPEQELVSGAEDSEGGGGELYPGQD